MSNNIFSGIVNNQKALNIFQSIKKSSNDHIATNNCLFNNCNQKAINSHILHKSKILNKISEKNHVIELRLNAYFGRASCKMNIGDDDGGMLDLKISAKLGFPLAINTLKSIS